MEKSEIIENERPNLPQVGNGMPLDNINQGTVAIEASRAIAEAQGKLIIAKRFPRDEVQAYSRVVQACQRKGIAEKAFYSYNRGGGVVSGPTIRFAEELARCWGNIDYGIKELSQKKILLCLSTCPTFSFPRCVHQRAAFKHIHSVQFNSVTQLCPTLCGPINCTMPGLSVHHQFSEFIQMHVH